MDTRFIELYNFIEAYKAQHGYSPSYDEIAEAFGVSRSQVSQAMQTMEALGMIVQPRGLLKAIKLLPRRPDWTPAINPVESESFG